MRVSDIGAHTADIAFDYTIKHKIEQKRPGMLNPDGREIKSYMPVVDFLQVTSMTPETTATEAYAGNSPDYFGGSSDPGSVSDDKLDATAYQRIYGWHSQNWYHYVPDGSKSVKVASAVQNKNFYRFSDTKKVDGDISGTKHMTLVGLEPSKVYDNHNVNANGEVLDKAGASSIVAAHAQELVKQGKAGQKINTDIMMMRVGFQTDEESWTGTANGFGTESGTEGHFVDIPAFMTKAEPKAPSDSDLNTGNKGDVVAPSNPVADSPSRIYIKQLSDQCKANVDGENTPDCFWSGYIYSSPTQLTDPTGAPFLTVKKDDKGYYVEPLLPADKTGEHKIALLDQNGDLAGWTAVNIAAKPAAPPTSANKASDVKTDPKAAANGGELASTGASVAVVVIAGVASLVAAAGALVLRRHRA